MKKGDKLFVRFDRRIENQKFGESDFNDHIKYLENIAKDRYFVGGGFENSIGGMILFEADSLEEAKCISDNDPLIKRQLYSYDIYEWRLVIVSEEIAY